MVAMESLVLPRWVALAISGAIFLGLAAAYRGQGVLGVWAVCSQVVAIIAVQLSTKMVLRDYPYPSGIASFHFFSVWFASTLLSWGNVSACPAPSPVKSVRSVSWYVRRILPIAVLQTLNVVLNTTSLVYIGAGFNALIGILCPVVTALVAACLGSAFSTRAWLGILLAICGDAVISVEGVHTITKAGEPLRVAVIGMVLGGGALIARAVRSVLMDCQMNEYAADKECPKLQPLELIALQSPAILVLGVLLTLCLEGVRPYEALFELDQGPGAMLVFSAACAVYLTYMGMILIKMLGAAAAQIAGKLNILVTVALSSAFLEEAMSPLFLLGAVGVLCGAGIFERAKAGAAPARGEKAEKPDDSV
ncbi:unnamed protein product [Effrenium voratum]|uniref:Sugar phosphate transporter domain-containing protein n=1 Tax=Effrenium voratum TaxID=2562239 RepID=A0AA36ITJ0_9DINO|nr:unnamed protein product [Effrenium voratum]